MDRLFDGLIAWSIRHRLIVVLVAGALFCCGIAVSARAPWDVLPEFLPPQVVVQTEAPGMSTLELEELVTRPLERALLGTPSLDSMRSSSGPGLSVITLTFDEAVDVYRARQLVTERLELARAQLPLSVGLPRLAPVTAALNALLKVSISLPEDASEQELRDLRAFGDWVVRPRLLGIPGVAHVGIHGGAVERIEVQPNLARLHARGVSIQDLALALRDAQAPAGAGFTTSGDARLEVVTDTHLPLARALTDLGDVVVVSPDGVPVRVGDVADVVMATVPKVGAAIHDGRPSLYLQVNKLPGTDTLELTRRVEAALDELAAAAPARARFEAPVSRQADFVRTSVRSVVHAMLLGGVLVVAVLIAFLRSKTLAAISLTAIPLSLVAALTVLVLRGETINGMILGGLAIAVGEVVDDAIVDVENVWRRLRENALRIEPRPALDVIRDASKEIRGSVVYATVIVCVVLLPVIFLGGIAGRIFSPLAQSYVLAIAASLLVALTVTPAMCGLLLPRVAATEANPTRLATWLLLRYRLLLGKAVGHPRIVFGSAATAVVAAVLTWSSLGGRFLPEFHERTVIAHVHAAPGASLEAAEAIARAIDRNARPDAAEHVATRIGRAELDDDGAPVHSMELDLGLPSGESRDHAIEELEARLDAIPGIGFVVEGFLSERIHEVLAGETAPIVVKAIGPELGELRALGGQIASVMQTIPELGPVRVEPQLDLPQLLVVPDRARLLTSGIRPAEVADAVVDWRHGRTVTQVFDPSGRIVDVALAGPPDFRERGALRDIPIATRLAGVLPLEALASIREVPAPFEVRRDGGERRVAITASPPGSALSTTAARLSRELEQRVRLPPGYRIEIGGEAVARQEAAGRLALVGGLVLAGIVVFLASAFGSLRDAGIVLLNLPLGLVGGVLASTLIPDGLSVAAFIGFVTLFGISARNGILLVTHKRHLELALPDVDAVARILRAAEERLLPVVMTAATAGLGLLPLALSIGRAGSELEAPMALIVCGGLVTATSLNLIVLPTVYVWLESRRTRRLAGGPG
ncbi:efflux RND transporter permease subunit [Vulgatibacter incomptus]|uniref:Cobalt-zinc-cadmium resistance protein CzcA n=1 Tax=Vulgatibacter incomptus TaxID=1391653 RepID=A0A0K1PIA5_9BACT|nr:efflux RND transporter permease subunit [Vulgatibacter incomptus]AKU93146.1 Cobalt-zinc-cadmium resistance protein CzcA [Vulgatibacter incomptus]